MMISFFDLSRIELAPFIKNLWGSSSKNTALYIRGSALLPSVSSYDKPIDIDFLLFTHDDANIVRAKAVEISNDAHNALPSTPRLDIKIINVSNETPEVLFNTLLVNKTGKLLYGKDLSVSFTLFEKQQHEVIIFALREAESKLNSVIKTSNRNIQSKRIPHLSKAILRIAGLLRLNEGVYTRSPQDCADLLIGRYPTIKENIAIILHSFITPILSDKLLTSYIKVLYEIQQDVERE
ncbi:hypothetical protein L5M18_01200 [Shewanella sp. SM20]|uniref:hypothetical protein n=1 Tax=Shewanella sp. SM20 TaxID=2912792 RepID=UPI0021D88B3B|nr:hypothetical protein [Shewanella sp. SM20]MCU8090195.1 hypothetical protein [Shewanella sp. SM20]